MVNIDAINPAWPRSIYLPDEEETLDKQVASGAVAARERGLVPQSGDWERPYRWVTPREMYGIGVGEEVEETEISETDFIVDDDGDKHAFGGGITGPIDLTEQISTVDFFGDERESVGGIWGDEMPRYWYHRPPSTESKGAEDGGIKAYVPMEEASVHYKFRGKGTKVVWIAPQPWANKKAVSITNELLQEITRGKATRVIDITKLDPNSFSSIDGGRGQIVGDIPIEAIVDSKRSTDKSERVKVYTGSDEPFTQFDEAKIATRTDPGFAGRGAYTTTDPKKAARWGKHVMETTIPSDARLIPIRGISELYKKYGLESLTFEESELPQEQRNLIYAKKINEFTDRMLDEGYDGVKWMMSTGDTQYVLFKPGKYEFAAIGQESPEDEKSLDKAVDTESIAEAKKRGLVPQSGDWKKPKRWVRPEDADVPVDEGKKPRKKATVDLKDLNYLKNPRDVERYTENRKKGLEQLPKLFGDDFTVNDLQDIWSSGVDDYSTSITEIEEVPAISGMGVVKDGVVGEGALRIFITITHDPTLADSKKPQEKHEDYEIMYFPIAGIMDRVFQKDIDGNLNVHHTLFQLEPYHQKKGIASDMSEHVEEEYEKLGVHSISFYANADVGGYTWARQGYDFARTSDRANIKKHFRDTIRKNKHLFSNEELKSIAEDIKSFKHAWEFASLSIERDSIPHNLGKHLLLGSKWDAVKILDKKSPGYQIGKAYFAAKRNTTKRNTTITG